MNRMNFNDENFGSLHREIRPSLDSDLRPSNMYPTWEPGHSEMERDRKRNDINISYSENTKQMYESKAKSETKEISKRASSSIVHQVSSTSELFSLEAIFSIKGLEYLSEGFFDIEPLLYKDDYLFKSKEDQERFEKSERSMKLQRMEQYEKKIKNSKREITLASIDQYRSNLEEYLEIWVEQNNRKMNMTEVQSAAMILDCDFELLNDLQMAFLKKRKLIISHKLYTYLKQMDTRSKRVEGLPRRIRRFFEGSKYVTEMPIEESSKRLSDVSGVTLSIKLSSDKSSYNRMKDYYINAILVIQGNLIDSHYKPISTSDDIPNVQQVRDNNDSKIQMIDEQRDSNVERRQQKNTDKISRNQKEENLNIPQRTVYPSSTVTTFKSVSSVPISNMVNDYNENPYDYRPHANARMMDKNGSLNITDQVSAYNKDPFGVRPKMGRKIPSIQRDSLDPYQAKEIEKKVQRVSEPQSFSNNEKVENRSKGNMTQFSPSKNTNSNIVNFEGSAQSGVQRGIHSSSSINLKQYTLGGEEISVHKLSPVVIDGDLIQHIVTDRKSANGDHKVSLSVYSTNQGLLLEKELSDQVDLKSLHAVVESRVSEIKNKDISKYVLLRDDSERNVSYVELKPYMTEVKKAKLSDFRVSKNDWVLKETNKESQFFVKKDLSSNKSMNISPRKTELEASMNIPLNKSTSKVNSVMTPKKSLSPVPSKKDSAKKSYSQLAQRSNSKSSVAKKDSTPIVCESPKNNSNALMNVNEDSKDQTEMINISKQETLLIAPMSMPREVEVYALSDIGGQGLGTTYLKGDANNEEIIHYLPSFNVGGQYISQMVKETMVDNKSVRLEIVTMTENGHEIGKMNIDRRLSGQTYCNILETGNSFDGKLTNVLITTFNNRGQLLLNQGFEINNLVSLNKKGIVKETLEETFENGDVVTTNIIQEGEIVVRSVRSNSNSIQISNYYSDLKANAIENIKENNLEIVSYNRTTESSIPLFGKKIMQGNNPLSQSISAISSMKPKGLSQINSRFSVSENGNVLITISGLINSNTLYKTRTIEIPEDTPSIRSNAIARTIYEMENEIREAQRDDGITTISYQMALESEMKLNAQKSHNDDQVLENSQISGMSKIGNSMRNQTSAPMLGFNENNFQNKVKSNTITKDEKAEKYNNGIAVPEIQFLKENDFRKKSNSTILIDLSAEQTTNNVQLNNHFSGFENEKSSTSLKNIELPTAAFPSKISTNTDLIHQYTLQDNDLKIYQDNSATNAKYFKIDESSQEYEEDIINNNRIKQDQLTNEEYSVKEIEYNFDNRGMSRGICDVEREFIKPLGEINYNTINQSTRSNSFRENSTIESVTHFDERNISVNSIVNKSFRKDSGVIVHEISNDKKSISVNYEKRLSSNGNNVYLEKETSSGSEKRNELVNSKIDLQKSKVSENKIDQILDNSVVSDNDETKISHTNNNIDIVIDTDIIYFKETKSSFHDSKTLVFLKEADTVNKEDCVDLNESNHHNSISKTSNELGFSKSIKSIDILIEEIKSKNDRVNTKIPSDEIKLKDLNHKNIDEQPNRESVSSFVPMTVSPQIDKIINSNSMFSLIDSSNSINNNIDNNRSDSNVVESINNSKILISQKIISNVNDNRNQVPLITQSKNSFKKISESLNNQVILEESSTKEKESVNSKEEPFDPTIDNCPSNINHEVKKQIISDEKVTLSSVFVENSINELKPLEQFTITDHIKEEKESNKNSNSVFNDCHISKNENSLFKDINNIQSEESVLKIKNNDSCAFKNFNNEKEIRFSLPTFTDQFHIKKKDLENNSQKDKKINTTQIAVEARSNKSTQVSNMTTSVPLVITNDLFEKSLKLKSHLDDFISSISSRRNLDSISQKPLLVSGKDLSLSLGNLGSAASTNRVQSPEIVSQETNEFNREVSNAIQANRKSIPKVQFEKLQETISELNAKNISLMDSFQKFCKERLPNDNGFKDSMLLTTMFYYFIRKAEKA